VLFAYSSPVLLPEVIKESYLDQIHAFYKKKSVKRIKLPRFIVFKQKIIIRFILYSILVSVNFKVNKHLKQKKYLC
jgi:uncharacterized protein with PQ loop repeat